MAMGTDTGADDQRAVIGSHPPKRDGQPFHAENGGAIEALDARSKDVAVGGFPAVALEFGQEDSNSLQSAPAVAEGKGVGFWLLRQAVKAVLVLGPVAAIIVLDVFKDRD